MYLLTSSPSLRFGKNMPRSAIAVALAAALGACGGGADLGTEASTPNASVAQSATVTDSATAVGVGVGVVAAPASSPAGLPAAFYAGPSAPSPPAPAPPPPPTNPPAPLQTACDSATGPVLEVGPGKKYAKPSAAAAAARAGDVIRIAAGDYHADVATWKVDRLTICGSGGRARLFADGKNAGGKALWVVSGANITIDSMEFHKAAVPDKNGAGIRAEHKNGDLHIINSGFYDNENGILTASGPVTLTIERSEFARNSAANTSGQTHNIYVNGIDRVSVSASYFHESRYGHNFKSRAKVSVLENNYLMDGPQGLSSYLADFPNGGQVILRGNLFQKGPKSPNKVAIEYGVEGQRWPTNTLEMAHNTVVMTRPGSTFLRVMPWTQSVKLTANILASTGPGVLISGSEFALGRMVQQSNVVLAASHFPGASNIGAPNFWPDAAGLALTNLPGVLDASYRYDVPAPHVLRPLDTGARRAGSLQSAP